MGVPTPECKDVETALRHEWVGMPGEPIIDLFAVRECKNVADCWDHWLEQCVRLAMHATPVRNLDI